MQSQFSAKSQGTWPKFLVAFKAAVFTVAGGGGGGTGDGGGGGAGGALLAPAYPLETGQTIGITIGGGGAGSPKAAGSNTTFCGPVTMT